MRISHLQTLIKSTLCVLTISALAIMSFPVKAEASSGFNAGRIIDDHIFFDGNGMSVGEIQAFLNSKVPVCDTWGAQPYAGTTRANYAASRGVSTPFICLKDYSTNVAPKAQDSFCNAMSGGTKSAAQIIKDASVACSVNPKVLIILLQKEQGLITDDWPWPVQYEKAMGFACPDTAPCDPTFAGLANQAYYAARQYQRYAKNPDNYGYRYNRQNYIQYNPNTNCGGTNVFIQNQATAGLYNYTPYQPNQAALNNLYGTGDSCSAYGNRNFWRMYRDWFGSPVSGVCYNGVKAVSTDVTFHKSGGRADVPDLLIHSGSGSDCIEAHIWNSNMTSWKAHIPSNQPGVNYPDWKVMFGDLDGDNTEYPILMGLRGTGSNTVEAHIWTKDLKSYISHSASILPVIDPAVGEVALADLDGDKRDEAIYIAYKNTGSGMIEIHGLALGMQKWAYHIATNHPTVEPANARVMFADLDGDRRDEAILVGFSGTGSGAVEFHVWNPGQSSWRSHAASNLTAIDQANSKLSFADVDGDGKDEAVLTGLRATGSGRVEFHVWNPGFTSWRSHTASNQQAL